MASPRPIDRELLPRDRLAVVLRDYLDRSGETCKEVARRAGMSERAVHRVLHSTPERCTKTGRTRVQQHVRFATADRLLCALEMPELFQFPPEHGGFADVYAPE